MFWGHNLISQLSKLLFLYLLTYFLVENGNKYSHSLFYYFLLFDRLTCSSRWFGSLIILVDVDNRDGL